MSLILPGWPSGGCSSLRQHTLQRRTSTPNKHLGLGTMLKGTGSVDSPLMYSMYSLVRAYFHSVSASAWGKVDGRGAGVWVGGRGGGGGKDVLFPSTSSPSACAQIRVRERTYMHACMHARTYTYARTHAHTHTCTHARTRTYTDTHTREHACKHTHVSTTMSLSA